jgi:hypothetical protein
MRLQELGEIQTKGTRRRKDHCSKETGRLVANAFDSMDCWVIDRGLVAGRQLAKILHHQLTNRIKQGDDGVEMLHEPAISTRSAH